MKTESIFVILLKKLSNFQNINILKAYFKEKRSKKVEINVKLSNFIDIFL